MKTKARTKAVLTLMAKITSIKNLSTLLNVVVRELPGVVGAVGCAIYLYPDYVPEYKGLLVRGSRDIREADLLAQASDDYIVLAATSLESKKQLVGKAFYRAGEGITGWVYKTGRPLRINNVANSEELKLISPEIYWANEYQDGDEFYTQGDKRPLLAVPLRFDDGPIGTLKFHATMDKQPFMEISQEIAIVVSHIISGVIRQTWMVAEQSQTIARLIQTGIKDSPLEVIADVTNSMKDMFNCSRSEVYLRSEDGGSLQLSARNGAQANRKDGKEFKQGQSLIGWVFKTGLPLIIPSIKQFTNGITADDDLLDKISTSHNINDDDRLITCEEEFEYFGVTNRLQSISLVAVPIKSKDQEVQGVLCGYWNNSAKMRIEHERSQLMVIVSFASTIALALENERQRILNDLLTKLGYLTQTDQLFALITEKIPKLVASSGCSIFTAVLSNGNPCLMLTHTSRKGLALDNQQVAPIEYEFGEGKTGMCGLLQSSLLANHYGKGKLSVERLEQDLDHVRSKSPGDVAVALNDDSGNKVGLFHLVVEDNLSLQKRSDVRDFAKSIVIHPSGMISNKLDHLTLTQSGSTYSFIAVPICSDHKTLGVITLARPTPDTPFLESDISLLKSIAGRLSSVMHNLEILKQREMLVISLAHEINTPLTGILADSQNIYQESLDNSELQSMAKHNLGQVQRLHMQASAIMLVLSDAHTVHHFTEHSIYRPLKEACELFESEASLNDCDILGPKARDGNFPTIEMSLFDLTIAFKNIVHNAVKYSFKPPINKAVQRTIKVWGQWDNKREGHYVVCVQNYGVGISQTEIERRLIFRPFYRGEKASDRKRTGSGFGLAHAQSVIEVMHHGFIQVSSLHQGGDAYLTTFSISLPIRQPR
jgi:signal transduction histidine kinase